MSEFDVHSRLCHELDQAGVEYQITRHEAVTTSEQAARVRGVSAATGAKALVVKLDDEFALAVLPGDRRMDWKRLQRAAGARRGRLATDGELLELTGLTKGSVPPFGSLFGLRTIVDPALLAQPSINFNAGSHTISVSMAGGDYVRIGDPLVAEIAE